MSIEAIENYGRLLGAIIATVGTGFIIALAVAVVLDAYRIGKK